MDGDYRVAAAAVWWPTLPPRPGIPLSISDEWTVRPAALCWRSGHCSTRGEEVSQSRFATGIQISLLNAGEVVSLLSFHRISGPATAW